MDRIFPSYKLGNLNSFEVTGIDHLLLDTRVEIQEHSLRPFPCVATQVIYSFIHFEN